MKQLEKIIETYQKLDNNIKSDFLSQFSEKEIKKSDFFISSNQFPNKLAFIKKGIFRVFFTDYNGNDVNSAFLLKNDFIIGRLKPITKSSVSVQAITNATILTADLSTLFKLAEKHHQLSQLFLKIASFYFDKNVDREIKLRKYDALNNYLFFLKDYPNLINQIPHYFIADYLQISSTHLSRIRKKLLEQ